MRSGKSHQAGFSLVEMLTVIAIIGILALVTVPNFISFQRTNKVKTSMRTFTSEMRGMRQMAIAQGVQTRITFTPDTVNTPASRAYDLWQGNNAFSSTVTWTPLTQQDPTKNSLLKGHTRHLDDIVYFPKTGQTFDATNGVYSVIFYPDGRAGLPANATSAAVILRTDADVPKQQYTVDVSPSGRVYAH
jgi:prepilin-type N-terminal cleavage/methylation domain-containing protein